MPIIANLSVFNSLTANMWVAREFANLSNYYNYSCLPKTDTATLFYYGGNFASYMRLILDYAYVGYQYTGTSFFGCCSVGGEAGRLFDQYKLGQLGTEQFLANIRAKLSFLEEAEYEPDLIADLYEHRSEYLSLKDITKLEDLKTNKIAIANALIEKAWNVKIDFNETCLQRMQLLLSKGEDIYLVSNSNELNIYKILHWYKQQFKTINWFDKLDISHCSDEKPVQVAANPNIYLCLSYRFNSYKTDAQNRQSGVLQGTPNLFEKNLNYLSKFDKEEDIIVVSQWRPDRETMEKLGVPAKNIFTPDDYLKPKLTAINSGGLKLV